MLLLLLTLNKYMLSVFLIVNLGYVLTITCSELAGKLLAV